MQKNSTVLITGTSSGIGRATAELFVRKGYRVFGGVRQPTKVEPLPGVELMPLDVREDASVKDCVDRVLHEAGHIHALVNNAGYSLLGAIEETSLEEAQALFDTNFFGTMRTIKAVLPAMREDGGGVIVNISSVLGFLPGPYMGLYAATKHALEGLSETLDHEVRGFGVRVVLVEPGFTRTKIGSNAAYSGQPLMAYNKQRQRVVGAIGEKIAAGAAPDSITRVVLDAVEGKHRMRFPVGSEPKLLSRLRKWLPPMLMDQSLRKEFRLDH